MHSELLTLQSALMHHLEATLRIVHPTPNRSFVPHLTVAFRDLTQQNFRAAWQEFESRSFHAEFVALHLTLLIHTGTDWVIHTEFPFEQDE